MTIRNHKSHDASMWDWTFLDASFPGKIKVMDVDGSVEIHGHVLLIETKGPGVPIPPGQQYYIDNTRARGFTTTFVVWGHPQKPERILVCRPACFRLHENASAQLLQDLCRRWAEWAIKQPRPFLPCEARIDWNTVLEPVDDPEDDVTDAQAAAYVAPLLKAGTLFDEDYAVYEDEEPE